MEIQNLRAQVASLTARINNFSKFLDEDQMKTTSVQKMSKWLTGTIVKALKFRLGLGVHGSIAEKGRMSVYARQKWSP